MLDPLIDVKSEREYGGKAVALGAALRAGLPVPPGFGLSVESVQRMVDSPAESRRWLPNDRLQTLGPMFAVRSSAVGEDSASASFAGQHATVLNVRSVDAMIAAVRTVWDSGRTAAAMGYRRKLGLDSEPRIAVVVQQLVESECAGVLFTRNPMTHADERVIEASWGLGEAVVAGLVTPDRYRVARNGAVIERSAGDKDIAIRAMPGGGTAETSVAAELVNALCLDDGRLRALHELAGACEDHFGVAQDLEFAFVGTALYLLQSRSITRGG